MENYNLDAGLCVDIYNYIETRPSKETGVMFALLKQEMERQNIEAMKKKEIDKIKAELEAEKENSLTDVKE